MHMAPRQQSRKNPLPQSDSPGHIKPEDRKRFIVTTADKLFDPQVATACAHLLTNKNEYHTVSEPKHFCAAGIDQQPPRQEVPMR
jgi:hypothetical protein